MQPVPRCSACREVTERSNLYERWLIAENHADGATLKLVAEARGFCSQHARRLLERDPDIAGAMAHFVLRAIAAQMEQQQRDRHGYRDALDARERCPWCTIEADALSSALIDATSRSLCQPHQRALRVVEQGVLAEPPLGAFEALSPAATTMQRRSQTWWSPQIEELMASLVTSCAACVAAHDASRYREAFLRRGPVPSEHWDAPILCAAHYAALNYPLTAEYQPLIDGVWRPCDWCLPIQRAARSVTELFSIAYRESEFRSAYGHTSGLCLPHAATILHNRTMPRHEFVVTTRVRIDTMVWELDERATRRSWQLRDQGALRTAADLSYRAWWLITGGTFRYEAERSR